MLKGDLHSQPLPPIPAKRYFTIGEVSELCGVKPHVLRYWEQEFTQLKPVKRRGNRRYYQHHEVLLIRRIRDLLYEQGFTISGARNRLDARAEAKHLATGGGASMDGDDADPPAVWRSGHGDVDAETGRNEMRVAGFARFDVAGLRAELLEIADLLRP
ncbi:MAG: MerR family transcriptional regulator [Burkholderiaceae bacterium]